MAMTKAGGKREGSGRKANPDKKQNFTMRLNPECIDKIKAIKKAGYKIGDGFELYITDLYKALHIE